MEVVEELAVAVSECVACPAAERDVVVCTAEERALVERLELTLRHAVLRLGVVVMWAFCSGWLGL